MTRSPLLGRTSAPATLAPANTVQQWVVMAPASPDSAKEAAWFCSILPEVLGSVLDAVEVALGGASITVSLHVLVAAAAKEHLARARFWAGQAGASLVDCAAAAPHELAQVDQVLRAASRSMRVPPKDCGQLAAELLAWVGLANTSVHVLARGCVVDLNPARSAAPRLGRITPTGVFLEADHHPPVGDEICLRFPPGTPDALQRVATRVVQHRKAGEGRPAGFGVVCTAAGVRVAQALACFASPGADPPQRRHPRFETCVRVKYSDGAAFSHDYVSNLSFGGAFVASTTPSPVDELVLLTMELPSGVHLTVPAQVVLQRPDGMAVQFRLEPEAERVLAAELARISCQPKRVLVVDDDADWRALLRLALEQRHVEVLEAVDGHTALQVLAGELLGIDLVVLDVNMPVMDGPGLIALVRGVGGEADLPIVVVSSQDDPGLRERVLRSGADLMLPKTLPIRSIITTALQAATEKRQRLALGPAHLNAPAAW